MGLFFDLLISISFSLYSLSETRSIDKVNSVTYNVFKDKTRKTLVLAMSMLNYAFLAVLCVLACVEIGSQIDLDELARSFLKIQVLINLLFHAIIIPISYFKRKKIVRELVREFERSERESYSDDELYKYVREHIVITKKELTKMVRAIKRNY